MNGRTENEQRIHGRKLTRRSIALAKQVSSAPGRKERSIGDLTSEKHRSSGRKSFRALQAICDRLTFERHRIAAQLDARGQYEIALDREFPFHVRLFQFQSGDFTPGSTWHERLELFLPLDGPARVRLGTHRAELHAGDLLLVEPRRLHDVEDFHGFDTRVVVVSFLAEFVFSLGSPAHDHAFLLPFVSEDGQVPRVLRHTDHLAAEVYDALANLLDRYFHRDRHSYFQAGCKAGLLAVLYHLTCRFQLSGRLWSAHLRQQGLARQLTPVFEYLRRDCAQKASIRQAAELANMSDSQFMKAFKRVAGMGFVAYRTHLRVSNAIRLLHDPERTVADIATAVGFSDQSHFDRQFKRAFGMSPRQYRSGGGTCSGSTADSLS
jgi:AraC-like DNA-binding protein/mannose-6-phosphate isomerase-like protein (cupin superfamily)